MLFSLTRSSRLQSKHYLSFFCSTHCIVVSRNRIIMVTASLEKEEQVDHSHWSIVIMKSFWTGEDCPGRYVKSLLKLLVLLYRRNAFLTQVYPWLCSQVIPPCYLPLPLLKWQVFESVTFLRLQSCIAPYQLAYIWRLQGYLKFSYRVLLASNVV